MLIGAKSNRRLHVYQGLQKSNLLWAKFSQSYEGGANQN